MASEKLYIKCSACDGHGSRKFVNADINSVMTTPPPFCVVCDGVGFLEMDNHEYGDYSNARRVNGLSESQMENEHAWLRELVRAIYNGTEDDYCKKYDISFDDVYATQIEAMVEFINERVYLHIDEGDPKSK